jgi:hypothetical protein
LSDEALQTKRVLPIVKSNWEKLLYEMGINWRFFYIAYKLNYAPPFPIVYKGEHRFLRLYVLSILQSDSVEDYLYNIAIFSYFLFFYYKMSMLNYYNDLLNNLKQMIIWI